MNITTNKIKMDYDKEMDIGQKIKDIIIILQSDYYHRYAY